MKAGIGETKGSEPIRVMHVLPRIERKLVALLKSLTREQWELKALPYWTVKDIAAHLLDGSLRRLSMVRDGYFGERYAGTSNEELVTFLNGLNADWVKALRRVSPEVLVEMVDRYSRAMVRYLGSLDPQGTAGFPVAWAGETASLNWFDVAREYTERWHHQQQIRDAVGSQGIMGREFYFPVLDTFIKAVPVAYRDISAPEGTTIVITVSGRAGGSWTLIKRSRWELAAGGADGAETEIVISGNAAWKLFTKGLSAEARAANVQVKGDGRLAEPIASVTAIMG